MEEINIKDFFKYIKKHILTYIIILGAAFVLTFIYSSCIKTLKYKTYTTLVLTKDNNTYSGNEITQNDLAINQKLVSTYRELINSKLILDQVKKDLNLNISINKLSKMVSVEAINDTEILKITVENSNPKMAKKIANEIASVFGKKVVDIYKLNNVSIIDKAQLPKESYNDNLLKDLIISLGIVFVITTGVLFIIYYFDDTIKNTEELEEEIGLPIIGKVCLNKKSKNNTSELIVYKNPKSVISEGIKTLRTSLQFSSVDNKLKNLLITSSIPGEGKSFISANLATAFAQTGKRVLLVDCDMRKGRQNKIFNVSNRNGLSDLLIDDYENKYASYIKTTEVSNLYLLTCGTIPPNPSELLNSNKNKKLIEFLKTKFDLIIYDGVPCNGLPDSIIMSTLVDKTLVVSAENITPKELLENTKKSLESVNANIAGDILNKVNVAGSKYYGKYYSYYGEEK